MTSTRLVIALLAFAWLPLAAEAAGPPLAPGEFAHRAPLVFDGGGPHLRATLPPAVYLGAARADLADLRVFNGAGEEVPYALTRPNALTRESPIQHAPRGLFPLYGGGTAGSDGLRIDIRQEADGRLVSIRTRDGKGAGQVTRGVLIDLGLARRLRLSRLDLELGAPNQDATQAAALGFYEIMVEASDDLQAWRTLRQRARIVLLEHAGRRLEQNRVELTGEAPRYLRLVWTSSGPAPAIRGARLWLTESVILPAPLVWHGPIAASRSAAGTHEYEVTGQIPLERLRIHLPQDNSLAEITVQRLETPGPRHFPHPVELPDLHGRPAGAPLWHDIGRQVVYRLQTPSGEITQPDLELDGRPADRLRLVVSPRGGGIGAAVPHVEIGFIPRDIVFLARGQAPFQLAWGLASAEDAQLPLVTLIPGYRSGQEIPAEPATVATADALGANSSAPAGTPAKSMADSSRKPLLWAVLIGAVVVLGLMAAALLRQTRTAAVRSNGDTPKS
jgi:hypothetical protein